MDPVAVSAFIAGATSVVLWALNFLGTRKAAKAVEVVQWRAQEYAQRDAFIDNLQEQIIALQNEVKDLREERRKERAEWRVERKALRDECLEEIATLKVRMTRMIDDK